MKRLVTIVVLIAILFVPFVPNAIAETTQVDLPRVLYSSWNANQAYGKAAIRIFSLIIAGLVISGVKALFKSNSGEKKTDDNQESETHDKTTSLTGAVNKSSMQEPAVSSDANDDGFDYGDALSQIGDASIESSSTQETCEDYSGLNASNNISQVNDVPMFCRKCGNRLLPDSIFCDRCGTKIK